MAPITGMDIVIGIDQSLTSAGIVALDLDGNLILSKVLRSKPGPDRYTVLYEGYRDFFVLMDHTSRYTIRQIIREHHAFGSEFGREAMGAAAAIVDMAVWDHFKKGLPHAATTQVKKFCAAQKKDQMRLKAFQKWGVEFKSNDEVDAYVLARIARGLYVGQADHLGYEQDVLAKIKDNEWAPLQTLTSQSKRSKMVPSSGSGIRRVRRQSPEPSPKPSTTGTKSDSVRSVRVRSTKR